MNREDILIDYWYAPWHYTMKCPDCDKLIDGVDKRASRCKDCAIVLKSNDKIRTKLSYVQGELKPERRKCPHCDGKWEVYFDPNAPMILGDDK